ncbi:MAG: hypothetical protein PHX40_04285 [Bacilli bacterium]|nr:hypothetical protein [Bacilli bacterium]
MKKEILINANNLNTRLPNSFGDYFNSLSSSGKEDYIIMYKACTNLLIKYLKYSFNLDEYEKSMMDNKIKPIEETEMDIYQYLSSNELKYFYIRNNLNIELLDNNDKELLLSIKDGSISNEKNSVFIENNYERLIKNQINDESHTISGPNSSNYIVPVNTLVLGFRYDEYIKRPNQTDEEWSKEREKIEGNNELLFYYMKKTFENTIHKPIEIIKYDEFSVNKKDEIEDKVNSK